MNANGGRTLDRSNCSDSNCNSNSNSNKGDGDGDGDSDGYYHNDKQQHYTIIASETLISHRSLVQQ